MIGDLCGWVYEEQLSEKKLRMQYLTFKKGSESINNNKFRIKNCFWVNVSKFLRYTTDVAVKYW